MPGTVNTSGLVGAQPIGDLFVPSTTQQFPLGQIIEAVDPAFGAGSFIYGKAGSAIALPGRMNHFDYQYASFDVPNAAGVGRSVFVNKAKMLVNTYGWFQFFGQCPVQVNASVAIGAQLGVAAAGQAGATAATKGLTGMAVVQPSTYAPTRTVLTTNGSPIIQVINGSTDGLFIGLAASGTGIAASTITAISPDGNTLTLSANCTATGTVTGTFTYTGFVLALLTCPSITGVV